MRIIQTKRELELKLDKTERALLAVMNQYDITEDPDQIAILDVAVDMYSERIDELTEKLTGLKKGE